jgi:hypothetical protein
MTIGQVVSIQFISRGELKSGVGIYNGVEPGGLARILLRGSDQEMLVVPRAVHSVETRRRRQENFEILKELYQQVISTRTILPYGLYQRLCVAVQTRSFEVIHHPDDT